MGDKIRITGHLMSGYLMKSTAASNAAREYLHEVLKQDVTRGMLRDIKRRAIEALRAEYTEPEDYVHVLGAILDLVEIADEQAIDSAVIGFLLEKLAAVEGGLKDARDVMQSNGYIQQQVDLVAQAEASLEAIRVIVKEGRP